MGVVTAMTKRSLAHERCPEEGFHRSKTICKFTEDFPGYHEYAYGNMDYFFDDCKEKTDFDWGPEYEE